MSDEHKFWVFSNVYDRWARLTTKGNKTRRITEVIQHFFVGLLQLCEWACNLETFINDNEEQNSIYKVFTTLG